MFVLRNPNLNTNGNIVSQKRYRGISNYQFYVKNKSQSFKNENLMDVKMYNRVRAQCENSEHGLSSKRICACIYDSKGRVLADGINSFNKTHPMQEKFGSSEYKIFLHAEIDAVVRALRKVKENTLEGLNLAISRVCYDNTDAQAFPCDGCIDALKYYGIESITYFDDERGICKFKL